MTLQNSLNLGKVSQVGGKPTINSDCNILGLLSVFPKIEAKTNFNGAYFYPVAETAKLSGRIDLWGDDVSKEYEFSFFRDTLCTNAKCGIGVYRPNRTDAINTYLSSFGTSYINAEGGWLGVGTRDPLDRLHVNNGYIRCASGLKLGANANRVEYAAAVPTTGTWARGDRVYNTAPSGGGFIGWVCVLGGTPGTWRSWGAISSM